MMDVWIDQPKQDRVEVFRRPRVVMRKGARVASADFARAKPADGPGGYSRIQALWSVWFGHGGRNEGAHANISSLKDGS